MLMLLRNTLYRWFCNIIQSHKWLEIVLQSFFPRNAHPHTYVAILERHRNLRRKVWTLYDYRPTYLINVKLFFSFEQGKYLNWEGATLPRAPLLPHRQHTDRKVRPARIVTFVDCTSVFQERYAPWLKERATPSTRSFLPRRTND